MHDRGTLEPAWINGIGAVTGFGWGRKHLWDGLLEGESCVVRQPDYERALGHEVWLSIIPDPAGRKERLSKYTRALQGAAREAIDDALERGWRPGRTVGLIHAFVVNEVQAWRDFYRSTKPRISRREYLQLMPSTPLTNLMIEHDFHGPVMSVVAMCASGNAGLITAKMWLDAGLADDVIVVSTDISGSYEHARQFIELGVLVVDAPPFDACRPFQEGSRGFVGGEAAVALITSRQPTGAYAALRGGAMSHDAYHVISLASNDEQLRTCYQRALANAAASPDEIVYFNAHGPGTRQCDGAESRLFDELFPNAEGIFSFKPLVGHCQAATAALEVVISCLSYDKGLIPAPPKVAPGHDRLVSGLVRRCPGATFKSSIGMGGYNTALLLDEPTFLS